MLPAEITVCNGTIEVSDENQKLQSAPAAIHLYVEDADATYDRARQGGAASIYLVAD